MRPGKKPKKDPDAGGSARLVRRLVVVALTLAAAGGLVWGVARLGDLARSGVGPRDRYAVRFADVECETPPGLDRAAFLAEARYASNFPESFQALDPDLAAKFGAAFTSHPWVASFDGVTVDPDRTVRVRLKFRTPALAVQTADGRVRVVDAAGVLLPADARSDGLPELAGPVSAPAVAAGRVWADADVRRALELVEAHHPRRLEKNAKGWRLTTGDGRVLAIET